MKSKHRIYNLFCAGFALLFTMLVLDVIFNNKTQFYTYRPLWLLVCTALFLLLLSVFYKLWTRTVPNFSAKRETLCVAVFLLLFFVLQLATAWCMAVAVTPGWDFGIV
ncbi:MAG: hypothetical protein RR415_08595, partial [Ruthenibacterium sp.]